MDDTPKINEQLAALAAHLARRRAAILKEWRKAAYGDPQLTTSASLPPTQFNDQIPAVLDAYERKLHIGPRAGGLASEEKLKESAGEHGLQRWQQGYQLREVTREWGHLQLCLADELANYADAHPSLEPGGMTAAWRALAQLFSEGVSESTSQYFQLQQTETVGRVRDLGRAIAEAQELERQRAQLWRQAAHDLRGNLGVVANATAGLTLKSVPEAVREDFVRLLQKSVSSLHSMLEDVMDLARLEAAHERRVVAPIDAAVLLRDLAESWQHLASERGLFLKADGPDTMPIVGDAVKIRRIVQNLLFNALKYTQQGGVTISWGDSRDNDAERWMLCVQDTGPGFHSGPGAPLARALKEATKEARGVEEQAGEGEDWSGHDGASLSAARSTGDRRPVDQEPGEGIGLSIVKRLCELLNASLELESKSGEGTIFRVVLPRRY